MVAADCFCRVAAVALSAMSTVVRAVAASARAESLVMVFMVVSCLSRKSGDRSTMVRSLRNPAHGRCAGEHKNAHLSSRRFIACFKNADRAPARHLDLDARRSAPLFGFEIPEMSFAA